MSRQLITIHTNEDAEQLQLLLDNFFKKNNNSAGLFNGESVIKKNTSLSFLNAHYIKIYFKENCILIEGWFTVSGRDYGLDDGIMYSEKHRALSQTLESIISALNNFCSAVENGTAGNKQLIDTAAEYEIMNPPKKNNGIIFLACAVLIIAAAFFIPVSAPFKAVIIIFGLIIGIYGIRDVKKT